MSDFENLVDAAKCGTLDDVVAILANHPEIVNQRDEGGATPLHHAAFGGHRAVAEFLIKHGAQINVPDSEFGATPAGWAIEYLREMGAFLGIELSDFAFAIERHDVDWVKRFLQRFPALRHASDTRGRSFKELARQCGDPEVIRLLESEPQLRHTANRASAHELKTILPVRTLRAK